MFYLNYLSTKECKFVDKTRKLGVENTGRMQGFETVLMISGGRVCCAFPSNSIISFALSVVWAAWVSWFTPHSSQVKSFWRSQGHFDEHFSKIFNCTRCNQDIYDADDFYIQSIMTIMGLPLLKGRTGWVSVGSPCFSTLFQTLLYCLHTNCIVFRPYAVLKIALRSHFQTDTVAVKDHNSKTTKNEGKKHFQQMKNHRSNILNLSSREKQAWKKIRFERYRCTAHTKITAPLQIKLSSQLGADHFEFVIYP